MNALLAHGGQITAQITKEDRSGLGAKTAGNFLAQFHHTQIRFGLIVVKGHGKILHEAQDLVVILLHAHKQIERLTFFAGSPFAGALAGRGIGRQARLHQSLVARAESGLLRLSQSGRLKQACCVHPGFDLFEQRFHVFGPLLLKALPDKGQIPQKVHHTQGMGARIVLIGVEAIVDRGASKGRQDAHRIGGLTASLAMDQIQRPQRGRRHMQPPELVLNTEPGLIIVDHLTLLQARFDPLQHRKENRCALLARREHAALRKGGAKEIREDLADPTHRQQMQTREIDRQRFDVGAILHRSHTDPRRQSGARLGMTTGALLDFDLVFGDRQLKAGHIKDLDPFRPAQRDVRQFLLAVLAHRWCEPDQVVRGRHHHQRLASMARLSTALFATGLAQALRFAHWLTQAVGRGRLTTVVAVFGGLILQLLDASLGLFKTCQGFCQRQPQGLIFGLQRFDPFFLMHERYSTRFLLGSQPLWGFCPKEGKAAELLQNFPVRRRFLEHLTDLKSKDRGKWHTILESPKNPSGLSPAFFQSTRFTFIDQQNGWATGMNPSGSVYLYRTQDGGKTWSQVNVPSIMGGIGFMQSYGPYWQSSHSGTIYVHYTTNAGQGYQGLAAYQTHVGGLSWTPGPASPALGSTDLYTFNFLNAQQGWSFGFDGQGQDVIHHTGTSGWSWELIHPTGLLKPDSRNQVIGDLSFLNAST